MQIKELKLTKTDDLITATPEMMLTDASHLLADNNIGALLVVDEAGQMVGILSERDIIRSFAENAATLAEHTVAELMTREVISCDETEDLNDVMELMSERKIRHVPVMSGGKLKSILSTRDGLSAMLHDVREHFENINLAYETVR